MPLLTTTIGAYPKPDYLELPDWFRNPQGPDTDKPTADWAKAMQNLGNRAAEILERATRDAVLDQINAGIDIPTDGEIARENYIHYHCRHLHGFDFANLTEKELRNGAYSARLPTIRSAVSVREKFLVSDWQRAQKYSKKPVKITLPGPLTISDTIVDDFYHDARQLGAVLADALNVEVLALAEAGCQHIQIDEPLFARKPESAIAFGMDNLERAFHRCPKQATRTVHMCCGYPDRLDNPDYPKANPVAYQQLAEAVDYSSIAAVSVEDAHRHNDLTLLEKFQRTQVILGVISIAQSRVESVDEIRQRLLQALEHIDAQRLTVAPDCGLGLLGRTKALAKLQNMCTAAKSL